MRKTYEENLKEFARLGPFRFLDIVYTEADDLHIFYKMPCL